MKHNKTIVLFLFLFIPLFSLKALEKEETAKLSLSSINLTDKKSSWDVGICEMKDKGILPAHYSILKTLPNLFYEKLLLCQYHQLKEEEQKAILDRFFEEAILTKQQELSKAQKEFDKLFFSREEISNAKADKQKSIREIFLRIEELKLAREKSFLYSIEAQKKVKLMPEKDESSFFPALTGSPKEFMEEKSLDMLISGEVEYIQGFFYYQIQLHSRYEKEPLLQIKNGGTLNDLPALVSKELSPFIEKILGRAWANVTIETWPMSATIRFNDGEKGVGILNRIYLLPGHYKVRLDAHGYISEEIDLVLEPNEEASHTIRMQKDLGKPIVIQTFPAQVDLYFSSEWKGKTPLLVEDAGVGEPFILRKENFSDFYGNMNDYENISSEIINIDLNSSIYINDTLLKSKRKDLYDSLTMMAVGVPFFLFGFSYDEKWKEFQGKLPSSPFVPSGKGGFTFDKKNFDVQRTLSGLTLLNQAGLSLFISSAINLIIDMVEYVELFDKM